MDAPAHSGSLFHDPKGLLLDLAQERTLGELLSRLVTGLAQSPRVALARVWLIQKSGDCTGCRMLGECPDRSLCLHLVASAGRSVVDPAVAWDGIDGAFRRFPLGVRKVGRIGATGKPMEVMDMGDAAPDWV